MSCLQIIILMFGVISSVKSGPIKQRREAFDPEKLMERYMDMRTNQGLFGSYHPNDLVQSIMDYFSHDGKQSTTDNQWGLFVYNPSDRMSQYMGNMKSPGNLGPQTSGHNREGQDKGANAGFAFNPNALNTKLLNDALSKGSELSKFDQQPSVQSMTGNGGSLGFDPNALNKDMISNAMMKGMDNGAINMKTTSATTPPAGSTTTNKNTNLKSGQSYGSQMLGFNPDTLNAGLLNSIHSQNGNNGGIANKNSADGKTNMIGFNPDQVNANLLGSLKYNPNSASANTNSAMFGEKTQGAENEGHSNSGQDIGSSSKQSTGNKASLQNTNGKTGNDVTPTSQRTGDHRYNAQDVVSNPFQTNIESGIKNSNTRMFGVNKNGVMAASGEMNNGGISGGFKAGGMGMQEYSKQNIGAPPGVLAGYELKQTEAAPATANGIGGLD